MAQEPPAGTPTPPVTYATARPVEGRAIAALIVGILAPLGAFLFFGISGVLLGAVAVFLGLTARSRIKKSGGVLGGGGMALAGWIAGVVGIVVGLAWALYLFALLMAMGAGTGKG
jgi:hypothetical protein